MTYLMLVRVAPDAGPATPEDADPTAWVEASETRRIFGERLRPADDATCVRVRDGATLVSHGPFVEVGEQIGGFDLLDVDSVDEAIAVAATHPVARFGALELRELRPIAGDVVPFVDAPIDYVMIMAREPDAPTEADIDDDWLERWLALDISRGGAPAAPPNEAVTVRVRDGETVVTRGPFADLQAYVDGYELIQAPDLDAAATHPCAHLGVIEIRPLWPF